jgi:hypothetical protein
MKLKSDPNCSDPYCLCKPRTPATPPAADATRRSIIFPDTKFPNDSNDVRNAYVHGEAFHGKSLARCRTLAVDTLRSAGLEFKADSYDRLSAITDDMRYRKELYDAFRLISLHDELAAANENHKYITGFLQFAIDNGALEDAPSDPDRSLREYLQGLASEIAALAQRITARSSEAHATRGWKTAEAARAGHETTHGTPEEKRIRFERYQNAVDLMCSDGTTYTEASQKVAQRFGVSSKTIQRHTSAPRRKSTPRK